MADYTPPSGSNVILNFDSLGGDYTPPNAGDGSLILEFGFTEQPTSATAYRYFIAIDGMS